MTGVFSPVDTRRPEAKSGKNILVTEDLSVRVN